MGICRDITVHCCDKLVQRSFALVQAPNRLTAIQITNPPVQWLAAETSDISESWHPDCKVFGKHLVQSVRPELVEGHFKRLILADLFISWFDKLTTNGIERSLKKLLLAIP